MRDYEITVVLKPDLEDEAQSEILGRIEGWLTQDGDEDQLNTNHWGLKTLAYPVRNYTEGYYVFYEVSLNPAGISEIERNFTYVDEILRHLVVRKND
jgi:small subunit ribosomal protein S6